MNIEHYNEVQLNDSNIDGWDDNLENILKRQKNRCMTFKILHEMEAQRLAFLNRVFSVVNVSLVSLIATGSSVTNDPPVNKYAWAVPVNIGYSVLLYFSAVIAAIQNYYGFDKNGDKNRTVSLRYSSLRYNIKRMLALKRDSRFDAKGYFEWVNKELDNIMLKAPLVSQKTTLKFEKKYPNYIKEEFVVLGSLDNDELSDCDFDDHEYLENENINYNLEQFNNFNKDETRIPMNTLDRIEKK